MQISVRIPSIKLFCYRHLADRLRDSTFSPKIKIVYKQCIVTAAICGKPLKEIQCLSLTKNTFPSCKPPPIPTHLLGDKSRLERPKRPAITSFFPPTRRFCLDFLCLAAGPSTNNLSFGFRYFALMVFLYVCTPD